jgi:hypothetical protein
MVNNSIFDAWSLVHIVVAALVTLFFGPWWALIITTAFEIFERFGQSMGWERFMPGFWNEARRNRWFGDIISNLIGIGLALVFLV